MDRSTLEKLILAKLPLPADFCQAVKDFFPLNPPTPTAALISQLKFDRYFSTMVVSGRYPSTMVVSGPDVRVTWIYQRSMFWYGMDVKDRLGFTYNPVTGEPIPTVTETPVPWLRLEEWDEESDESSDEEYLDAWLESR